MNPGVLSVHNNRVIFVARDGTLEELPLLSKRAVGDRLLDRVVTLLEGR